MASEFPLSFNDANLVLTLKVNNPATMKDIHPISLYNFNYKIISKALVNRLKSILHTYISYKQSNFVKNRFIHDNVKVAIEIIHHMKC